MRVELYGLPYPRLSPEEGPIPCDGLMSCYLTVRPMGTARANYGCNVIPILPLSVFELSTQVAGSRHQHLLLYFLGAFALYLFWGILHSSWYKVKLLVDGNVEKTMEYSRLTQRGQYHSTQKTHVMNEGLWSLSCEAPGGQVVLGDALIGS